MQIKIRRWFPQGTGGPWWSYVLYWVTFQFQLSFHVTQTKLQQEHEELLNALHADARPHTHTYARSAGCVCVELTRLTSGLTGYHPSQSIMPKVSVCDGAACGARETANHGEAQRWGQGPEVAPVPTVAEGACLCSLSPHQHSWRLTPVSCWVIPASVKNKWKRTL